MRESQFLTDQEKLEYYAQLGDVDLQRYPYVSSVKIYEGAEILMYYYDSHRKLHIVSVLLCTDIRIDRNGIKVTMLDKKSYKIMRVGEIPHNILDFDILFHTFHRCAVERVVKRTKAAGRYIQDITTALCFRSTSDPKEELPYHVQAVPYTAVKKRFTEDEFEDALQRAQKRGIGDE